VGHSLFFLILDALLIPRWFCYEEDQDKTFELFNVFCSALLDSMIVAAVALYFLTRISIMTAWGKFKPQILWRDGFIAFDSLQSEKVTKHSNRGPSSYNQWRTQKIFMGGGFYQWHMVRRAARFFLRRGLKLWKQKPWQGKIACDSSSQGKHIIRG